ncbi:hypothetical protein FB451DRAFT_1569846 [Mycena latifolia]|nr:hypothetical protein FB451DRAFT_1377832 [Mycena latifolia]KAJ7439676.1 hypothetical protein FB451DRAFT_1569846 [Mycena latifolia]
MSRTKSSSSHASRNPSRPVQTSRRVGRPTGKLTESQKATRALQAARRKVQKNSMEARIDGWYEKREEFVAELVKEYNRSAEYIRGLLMNPSQFKSTRAVNIRNAIVHDLHVKAKERGEKMSLQDLSHVADHIMQSPIPAQETARLKAQLQSKRHLKRVGMRSNNLSAAADARAVATRVQEEFMNLFERTGTRAVAFLSRGHVDDAFLPTYAESGGSMDFFLQSTKTPGLDLLRRYELWCCNQDRSPLALETLNGLRGQIKFLMDDGLQTIVKDASVSMSYANNLVAIQQAWKVKLVGWPDDIPFVNPSKLGTIDRVRRVRDGLRNGSIHWVQLGLDEIAEVDAEVERCRADGTLRKPRKQRTDIGKKHKHAARDVDDSSDDEDEDDTSFPGTSAAPIAPIPSTSSFVAAAPTAPIPSTSSFVPSALADADATDAAYGFPSDFDFDFDFDFNEIASQFNTLAAGGYDTASSALQSLNTFASPFPAAGVTFPGPYEAGSLFPGVNVAGGAFPAVNVTGGAFPTVNIAGGAFPTVNVGAVPLGPSNAGGFQFGAPATPASFSADAAPSQRRVVKAKTRKPRSDVGKTRPKAAANETAGAQKTRKPRSDIGKTRPKAAAKAALLQNETPAEKAARLAKMKAAALKKIAARAAGRA